MKMTLQAGLLLYVFVFLCEKRSNQLSLKVHAVPFSIPCAATATWQGSVGGPSEVEGQQGLAHQSYTTAAHGGAVVLPSNESRTLSCFPDLCQFGHRGEKVGLMLALDVHAKRSALF